MLTAASSFCFKTMQTHPSGTRKATTASIMPPPTATDNVWNWWVVRSCFSNTMTGPELPTAPHCPAWSPLGMTGRLFLLSENTVRCHSTESSLLLSVPIWLAVDSSTFTAVGMLELRGDTAFILKIIRIRRTSWVDLSRGKLRAAMLTNRTVTQDLTYAVDAWVPLGQSHVWSRKKETGKGQERNVNFKKKKKIK